MSEKTDQKAPTDRERTGDEPPYETAFQRLVGRWPNEAERQRFYAVRETLRLRETDAIWALFVALEHYLSLYERFPPMIRAAAEELLVECKTGADRTRAAAQQQLQEAAQVLRDTAAAEVAQSAVEAKQHLEQAIQQAARRIAFRAGRAARWPWVLGGAASMALALIFTLLTALFVGRQQGYAAGYTEGLTVAAQRARAPALDRLPPPTPPRGR